MNPEFVIYRLNSRIHRKNIFGENFDLAATITLRSRNLSTTLILKRTVHCVHVLFFEIGELYKKCINYPYIVKTEYKKYLISKINQ